LAHLKEEKEAGKEIYPAFAGLSVMGDEGNEADKSMLSHSFTVEVCSAKTHANGNSVCKQLECGSNAMGVLAW
jgi:hypothetical protein